MWRRTVNRKQSRFAPPATSPASDLMSGSDSRAGPAERYQSSTTALTDGRDTSERHLLRRGRVGGPSRNQSVRPLQKVAALVGALTDKQPSSGSADRQAASGITVEDPGADLTESRLKSQTAGWIAMKESGLWASPLLCVVVLGCLSWVHPGQALKKTGQASKKSGQALKKPGSNASGLARQPHLIFIMVDDQGYNDVGYHGSLIQTPVLDRLAAKGVKLENYYVQPICSPSRSQLMTGRYQIHTGLQHSIIRPRQPLCLPPDTPTLAERLREAGYSTHMVGKWHLGFCRPGCLPTGRGFQTFLGSLTGSGDHYTFHNCDRAETCGFDLHDGERPAWEMSGNYSTLLYTQRVKKILRTHDHKRPLFLYLALQAVHTPLQAPTRFLQMYSSLDNRQRRHYAAMVSCVDEAVGEVVQELRDRGLYRNSVLIYSTDNGGQPLSGGSNWPLRGGKGTYWEGGVRAVGFVHSPLLKRKGVVNKALVHISDWYPTLLSLAGASAKSLRHLDGHNVWAAISEGLPSPRTEILFNIDPVSRRPGAANPQTLRAGFGIWDTAIRASIRAGDWKLLTGNVGDGDWVPPQTHAGGPAGWEALEKRRDQPWKSVWLFNITADPYERRDLSKSRPEVVKVLMARLAEYNQTAIPPRNPPDDPFADPQLHGGVWTPWLGQRNRGTQRGKGVGAKGKRRGRMKDCKVCKLRALFRKVGTRLQRAAAFF